MSEDNIQSTLHETRHFPPSAEFLQSSALSSDKLSELYASAERDNEAFWAEQARNEIDWQTPFSTTLDSSDAPFFRWFPDGKLNVSYNCLDRQLENNADKIAIIFEGDAGDVQKITYRELHSRVCVFANALKAQNISKGDRVIIYMPMIAEAVVAMQACARIGAIHSVVFGGFSASSLKDRIEDTQAKMVITADGGHRGGRIIELKSTTDSALETGCNSIESVIVFKRTSHEVAMQSDRDVWWSDAEQGQTAECEPEWMNATDPLFLLYTSGSTGKPKGIQHSTGGYLLNAVTTMRWVFDIQGSDVFWCTADVGWITGHTYVAYGPLATGATIVIFEGVPTYPDAGRFWAMCQRHGVTIFYTAPTAIRALIKQGDDIPNSYDLSKLRLLGTVGEPINPEAWMWYHNVIGQQRCPIVDTWWQTETGAHMIAPVPSVTTTTPGSCTRALPGIDAAVVNEKGEEITNANEGGYLVMRKPWPSMIQTVWGDDKRYKETYWPKFGGKYYLAGDSARRDENGFFWIMGRIDDVLNVSGHRLGTMEIESALVANPLVAEAAVVGKPHEIKGESVFAYVVLKGERPADGIDDALTQKLRAWVGEQIGAIAKPDEIRYADNLPKTRSGKIMRRLLRTIAKGDEITSDTSTLENESILPQLQGKA
ncbi:MAG: acetate--CoA ligase [Methylophagaceae bacterium]